jgi:hypothetical protein
VSIVINGIIFHEMASVRRLRNDIVFVGDVTVLSSFGKKTNSNLIASSKRSALAATLRR